MMNQPNIGEQALDKVAEMVISSQLEAAIELDGMTLRLQELKVQEGSLLLHCAATVSKLPDPIQAVSQPAT